MSEDADPLEILGKTLEDKYRIDALAGLGGFSAVYRAQHLVWNEPVAIKFFTMLEDAQPELREKLLQDFIQEGKLMTKLSSRSTAIVQARDMGKLKVSDDGDWIPYMVLEWLDGTPLDQVISRERRASMTPRSLQEVMGLLEPAAIALDIAHRGNVAHRDLKPANFVITGDPRDPESGVKVLDFGIAKVMEGQIELQEQLQLTGQHVTAFTPNYGAPEQFSRNFGATGPWTDVFAMALIALELMRGRRVLDGETFFELGVMSSDQENRPTPRALGLDVSDEVEAVFAKALTVDPKQRYTRMGEFWQSLHRCVFPDAPTWSPRTDKPSLRNIQSGPQSIVITPSNPQSLGAGHPDTVAAVTFTGSGQRRRKPILWAAAAVAVASIGVLAVTISTRQPSVDTPTSAAVAVEPSVNKSDAPPPPPTSSEKTEPHTEPSAETQPAASTTASAAASMRTSPPSGLPPQPPKPQALHPGPKTPPPSPDPVPQAPKPKPGENPWDPSSFGGRR